MQLPTLFTQFTPDPLEWQHTMRSWYRTMRENKPVWYDEQNECWRVFRYDTAQQVLSDYKTFSSESTTYTGPPTILAMDPPRHRRLRTLVTPAFSARTIAQQAPRIQEITTQLVTKTLARGSMDLVSDLAIPLPILVISDMLGLPHEEWPRLKQLSDASVKLIVNPEDVMQDPVLFIELQQQLAGMHDLFMSVVADHRQHPRPDVMTLLLEAEVEGNHLSDDELYGFFLTLLTAGNLTTTQLLGNAILCFDQNPEAWHQLCQDPTLLPSAIEEILRYLPPARSSGGDRVAAGGRLTTTDVTLEGHHIPKDSIVYPTFISANFDERQFPDPDRFDIQRNPNRHLSFGHGIHFCLGAPLARLETKIALETLLKLTPEWHLSHDEPLQMIDNHIVFGVKKLPITFQSV